MGFIFMRPLSFLFHLLLLLISMLSEAFLRHSLHFPLGTVDILMCFYF